MDGYMVGVISPGETDFYRLRVPRTGPVTIETSAWLGAACGFTRSANTRLTLLKSDLTVVTANDDIDNSLNLCSRIREVLNPGTYYLVVEAASMVFGSLASKRYRIAARMD